MKYLSVFISCLALLLASCALGDTDKESGALENANDSISYAVGMQLSKELAYIMTEELGVGKEYTDDFVRGVCHAFPTSEDASEYAYAQGLYIGSRAIAMLRRAQSEVYGNDTTVKINREHFLNGIVAAIQGGGHMDARTAMEYYNYRLYREASEKFMRMNATRDGVVALQSGLQYKVYTMGKGEVAAPSDIVRCIYRGTFTDGTTFDSSRGEAVDFPVANLIPGFTEALCTLPVGTKCKLYIPWNLAYGERGNSSIPPYSTLVFDLEIIEIVK